MAHSLQLGLTYDNPAAVLASLRTRMVTDQLVRRGLRDERVLEAMVDVPRELFVPETQSHRAYEDRPLPIGYGVTISQPYIVALMCELAEIGPGARVLDVGTGSGYQAAILAQIGAEVYSIDIIAPLVDRATQRLAELGFFEISTRWGDGYRGWLEHAPYDAIVVAAAPREVPEPLKQQLALGGRLVIPVGDPGREQTLKVITRVGLDAFQEVDVLPVTFVAMVGERVGDSCGCAFGRNRTIYA